MNWRVLFYSQVISKRQTGVFVEPDDIIITNIRETESGVQFDMYVDLDEGSSGMQGMQVLPVAAIEEAVEVCNSILRYATIYCGMQQYATLYCGMVIKVRLLQYQ